MDTPTTLDSTTDLQRHATLLDELEGGSDDQPIVSGSFDLRPGAAGAPTVIHLLRQAARRALPLDAPDVVLEQLVYRLHEALESVAADGRIGAFVAGPLEAPATYMAATRVPPRNQLWVGEQTTRFELERSLAALRTPVAAVAAERGRLRWVLTQGHGQPLAGELAADDHYMRRSSGRTGQHDRGGSSSMRAGGHSKTHVERSAEEERERFARDAAEIIEQQLSAAALVQLSGPPEFTARLAAHLSARLRDRIEELDLQERPRDADVLLEVALERAVQLQYEQAASLRDEIIAGAHGERGASGNDEMLSAIEQGRLEHLVLDEDAAGHYGDAIDARPRAGWAEPSVVEDLLRRAKRQSATVWFSSSDGADEAAFIAPVGVLRW